MDIDIIEFGIKLDCQRYEAGIASDERQSEADRKWAAKMVMAYGSALSKLGAALLDAFDHRTAVVQ